MPSGRKPRPPDIDQFAKAFNLAGEDQEMAADEATLELLGNLPDDTDIEKAQTEFERAQKVEEQFDKDFDSERLRSLGVAGQFRLDGQFF